jgi:dihydroorotase
MAINPRTVLQTEVPIINEGHTADITLFNPTEKWEFNKENNLSLSDNTPVMNTELTGKVIGTILKNKFHSNN